MYSLLEWCSDRVIQAREAENLQEKTYDRFFLPKTSQYLPSRTQLTQGIPAVATLHFTFRCLQTRHAVGARLLNDMADVVEVGAPVTRPESIITVVVIMKIILHPLLNYWSNIVCMFFSSYFKVDRRQVVFLLSKLMRDGRSQKIQGCDLRLSSTHNHRQFSDG